MSIKFSLFQNDQATMSVGDDYTDSSKPRYRFSGPLSNIINISDSSFVSRDFVSTVAVSSRDYEVLVVLSHETTRQEYTVSAGKPLLVQSLSDEELYFVQVIPSDMTRPVNLEVEMFATENAVDKTGGPFLILNAGLGVTVDQFSGAVTAWKDVRPFSGAPEDFDSSAPSGSEATLSLSDPSFGGQPAVHIPDINGLFTYSTADPIWGVLDGTAPFTITGVMELEDNGIEATICDVAAPASSGGVALLRDGGNLFAPRLASSVLKRTDDEPVDKAQIVILHNDDDKWRIYFQGRWEEVLSSPSPIGPTTKPMELFASMVGKVADFRVYDRALSNDELDSLIQSYVATYAIDDTEEQGFPDVAGVYNLHRSNRGASINTGTLPLPSVVQWSDTRANAATSGVELLGGLDMFLDTEDAAFNGQDSFRSILEGFTASTFSGFANNTANGWDHLDGVTSGGFTLGLVFYTVEGRPSSFVYWRSVITTGSYASVSDPGSNIYSGYDGATDGELSYLTDDAVGAEVVDEGGGPRASLKPFAILYSVSASGWIIREVNLETGEETSRTGSNSNPPTAQTLDQIGIFTFAGAGSVPENLNYGGIAEFFTNQGQWDTATGDAWVQYVQRRYQLT